jgi:hypothetical protein
MIGDSNRTKQRIARRRVVHPICLTTGVEAERLLRVCIVVCVCVKDECEDH